MTKPFTVTQRSSNGYYVDTKPGSGWHEMTPRWLDDQTLELGISEVYHSLAAAQQSARARASIPQLDEALKWCAARRMGVKLTSVQVKAEQHVPLVKTLQEVEQEQRSCGYKYVNVLQVVLGAKGQKMVASHRLEFTDFGRAFEFKLRWG
jgi:hypothetical protein